ACLALLEEDARLRGKEFEVGVLEQHVAVAVLQNVKPPKPRDAHDAFVLRRRADQVELRVTHLGRAGFPADGLAAQQLRRKAADDLVELARSPHPDALLFLSRERDHRHSVTSNSNRWSSGS